MLYYEIVRLDDQNSVDADLFDTVRKMVRRGWLKKAMDFLSQWDYGNENLAAAHALGEIRDTITDPLERSDRILRQDGDYALCESSCPSGLYNAFYLVCGVSAPILASI